MNVEPCRSLREWLADPGAQGVNATLAAQPKDAGDVVAAIATFADETTDVQAAEGRVAKPAPSCTVTVTDTRVPEIEGVGPTQDFQVDVLVQVTYDGATIEQNVRDAGYAMRAVIRSLRHLHEQANDAARSRNGVVLYSCLAINPLGIATQAESAEITAGVLVTYQGRDSAS